VTGHQLEITVLATTVGHGDIAPGDMGNMVEIYDFWEMFGDMFHQQWEYDLWEMKGGRY